MTATEKLRHYMESLPGRHADKAKAAGMDRRLWDQYLHKCSPGLEKASVICKSLGITLSDIDPDLETNFDSEPSPN